MTIVAHRILLIPNQNQIDYFRRAAGISRHCWNWALAEWIRQREAGEKPTAFGLKKSFNAIKAEEFPWADEVHSQARQQAFADLGTAFTEYFRRIKKGDLKAEYARYVARKEAGEKVPRFPPGHPKFKQRGRCRDSFYVANIEFKVDGNHVKIARIGEIRMRETLRFDGKIMAARISRSADKWFISIQVEVDRINTSTERKQNLIGVDLGSQYLGVLSNGDKFQAPKSYSRQADRLARLQGKLKHLSNGSNRERKLRDQIARLHYQIAENRRGAQHQFTAWLAKRYKTIAVQRWNLKKMTKSAKGTVENPGKNVDLQALFNRHMLDSGCGEIYRQLEYKLPWFNGSLVLLEPDLAASQICARCDHKNDFVGPDLDGYQCENCGARLDRKVNHAANVKRWAEDILKNADSSGA